MRFLPGYPKCLPEGLFYGGERGIRTLDSTLRRITAFEAAAFDHSAISPDTTYLGFTYNNHLVYNTAFSYFRKFSYIHMLCKPKVYILCKSKIHILCKPKVCALRTSKIHTLCKPKVYILCKSKIHTLCKSRSIITFNIIRYLIDNERMSKNNRYYRLKPWLW